jgi:hypothetical protein
MYDAECPCEGAFLAPYVRIDERTVDGPNKVPCYKYSCAEWYADGRNHRVEDGHIKRDFDDEAWFIEIATIEEFIAFVSRYTDVLVGKAFSNPSIIALGLYHECQ